MTVEATVELIQVRRYRCAYCHKGFWEKKKASQHVCFRDPQNRGCLSCVWDLEYDGQHGWYCGHGIRPEHKNVLVDCPLWEGRADV